MTYEIHHGHVLDVLRAMPDASVSCVVTSPPYWGLRDYGVDGQIGLEPTPEAFVAKMVEVFAQVRRVLCETGTCWINLGDSYVANGANNQVAQTKAHRGSGLPGPNRNGLTGLAPKNLVGIPWRVALALQAEGWWLRSDIIWHKPNPMPESVTDRPTKAHEYVFLLTKAERYYYNYEAVKEPQSEGTLARFGADGKRTGSGSKQTNSPNGLIRDKATCAAAILPNGRNKRTVWTMATQATPDAHFATFPIELPETCILAGCPIDGLVLDPFAGSGTTGLAALKQGRRFVGVELNAEYIEIARTRLMRHYPLMAEQGIFAGARTPA